MAQISIKDALNKAFVKVRPERAAINNYKANLIKLIDTINNNLEKRENFHITLFSDFLKNTWYSPDYSINSHNDIDLVIHDGNENSPVCVLIEAKKPNNKNEMISRENLNAKAFHELLYYYLIETIDEKNINIKHLIITNAVEWFIFDAKQFHDHFYINKTLVKNYNDFKNGKLEFKKTEEFYTKIAAPEIEKIKNEIEFCFFNITEYEGILRNNESEEDNKLIDLYKILSPTHLLKKTFVNDSNTLNDNFYFELLYIMGLTEKKEDGKKIITRYDKGNRQSASLIEETIYQLDLVDEDMIRDISHDLIITWINRIIFLKLLETQQLQYQNKNNDYSFLNINTIKNFNDLNILFFKVLAVEQINRDENAKIKFKNIPYLNSSLFETTDNEDRLKIAQLRNEEMDIFSSTVLKDEKGNKRKGKIKLLDYLFEFLNAYDFSSEGAEIILEEKKTLINASVLGLIFEKINGYKDGSYFTPGFVTSYICSETVKNVVIEKFNKEKCWNVNNIDGIYNKIKNDNDIAEANKIINSITIVDPAVGSGHFLVSALNELIAIKSELEILVDSVGKRIKINIEVKNDELIITDEWEKYFEYKPNSKEKQRIQETLFQEKRRIIENCLFGVDINPNSVKICCLRLWIELLKNAYYTKESGYKELETLPNLNINIKEGNSLISRFKVNEDFNNSALSLKHTIKEYKEAVQSYRNSNNKNENKKLLEKIKSIKMDYSEDIAKNNNLYIELKNLENKLGNLGGENIELGFITEKEIEDKNKKVEKVKKAIAEKNQEIDNFLHGKIYENAFEWRFEFPEVLDPDGKFMGFDAVIGNPPYIKIQNIDANQADYLKNNYKSSTGKFDIYVLFIEKAFEIINEKGFCTYIQPHRFINADYGKGIRDFLYNNKGLERFINFGVDQVFGNVTTYTGIFFYKLNNSYVQYCKSVSNDFNSIEFKTKQYDSLNVSWSFEGSENEILNKIYNMPVKVLDVFKGIYQGVITVGDDIFILEGKIKNKIFEGFSKELNKNVQIEGILMKPLLKGEDIKRYRQPKAKYFIFYPHVVENGKTVTIKENVLKKDYPLAYKYMVNFKEHLKEKKVKYKTNPKYWYSLHRPRDKKILETKKLLTPQLQNISSFAYDENKCYPDAGGYIFIPYKPFEKDIFAYYGIFNSSLFYYFIKSTSTAFNNDYYYFKNKYIEPFKFPDLNNNVNTKNKIIEKVENIIKNKDDNIDTKKLEKQVDDLVYSLYRLTSDEIEIIEKVK